MISTLFRNRCHRHVHHLHPTHQLSLSGASINAVATRSKISTLSQTRATCQRPHNLEQHINAFTTKRHINSVTTYRNTSTRSKARAKQATRSGEMLRAPLVYPTQRPSKVIQRSFPQDLSRNLENSRRKLTKRGSGAGNGVGITLQGPFLASLDMQAFCL